MDAELVEEFAVCVALVDAFCVAARHLDQYSGSMFVPASLRQEFCDWVTAMETTFANWSAQPTDDKAMRAFVDLASIDVSSRYMAALADGMEAAAGADL